MAMYKLAVRVIMVHKHPGGNVTPSTEDQDLTDHFIASGQIPQGRSDRSFNYQR